MRPDVPKKDDLKINNKKIAKDYVIVNDASFILSSPLLCACNGLKCNGICRETHLYRKRTNGLDKCPSAYIPRPKIKKYSRVNLDQDRNGDRDKRFRRQRDEEHTVNNY